MIEQIDSLILSGFVSFHVSLWENASEASRAG